MSLKCPYCDGSMISGQSRIHGTFGGFLIYGFSYENLYFKPDSGEEIKILGSTETSSALRCVKCGTVILNFEQPEPPITEVQQVKNSLIELLTLCSSKELRESIQNSNREIDLESEIIKTWKEKYIPNDTDFKNSFSPYELRLLEDFDKLIQVKNWGKIESSSESIMGKLNNR